MHLSETGGLIIQATQGSGSLPVEGVIVRIRGAEEENRFIVYSQVTDEDGNTKEIRLPAPKKELSLSAGAAERPYSIYDVEISADGYFSKKIYSLPIFPGIKATQPINMIPLSEDLSIDGYPRGNITAIVRENPSLEKGE